MSRGQCERCPRTDCLCAHHIDEDRSNNTLENGECLCVWCHDEEHEAGGRIVALYEGAIAKGERWQEAMRARRDLPRTEEREAQARAQALSNAEAKRGIPLSEEHKAKVSASAKASTKVKAHLQRLREPGGALYERRHAQQEA